MQPASMSTSGTAGGPAHERIHATGQRGVACAATGCVNVGDTERLLSGIGGSALVVFGMSRRSLPGFALAALGAGLLYRGFTGHCPMYQALGLDTAAPNNEGQGRATSVPAGQGVRVDHTVTISRPPEDLYAYWRRLDNLPRIMTHLEAVTPTTGNRSHWVARGPLGTRIEWDAEVINQRPNELIAWRSLPGSTVDTAGSVHFRRASDGQNTEVRVELKYLPPAGRLGAAVARLLGEAPEQQIAEDLREFKRRMEAGGTVPAGQASSVRSGATTVGGR